jgi:cellulose synthase (UDP-forming)
MSTDIIAPSSGAPASPSHRWTFPSPPTDYERDSYLKNQARWIALISFAGYLLILASVSFFIYHHPWSGLLAVPLLLTLAASSISLVTSTRRRRFGLAEHRATVDGWQPGRYPAVDVFLPSAGEDLAVLANTYRHVADLHWPGSLEVYVLDDSARPDVAALAGQHGFTYLTRPDRGHLKKAGNLRFGFAHSAGDLIAILDADFVPRSDMLAELAPYFDDPEIAIVQSPQFFDATPQMNWLQRAAGATQVLFYRWVQPSRDRSNAAICVGTSALYRRSALAAAGGFAQIGHSEDVHTGVKLLRAGYLVRYVPTVVTKGLCPSTFGQFVTQQYRWCTGSMSLLFSRDFHRTRLTAMQRLSYWSGFLYYISTAVNIFAAAIPPILMGYFAPGQVRPANYVFVTLAMVSRQTVIPLITQGHDSLFGLARIQATYSFSHAVALLDVLRGRTDDWVATGSAAGSKTSTRVHRTALVWIVLVQVLLWGAIAWHAPHYGLGRYWPMMVFALLALYISYPVALGRADVRTRLVPARREHHVAGLETAGELR